MDSSNAAITELWDAYRAHYPNPQRPIHSLLMESYVRRLARLLEVSPVNDDLASWQQVLPEVQQLTSELKEIWSYLGENPIFLPNPPGRLGQFLVEQGFSFVQVQQYVESVDKRPVGRRQSARVPAVRALEIRRLDKVSWRGLAIRLCPCGADHHNHDCAERIRQAVMELEKTLDRVHIGLP